MCSAPASRSRSRVTAHRSCAWSPPWPSTPRRSLAAPRGAYASRATSLPRSTSSGPSLLTTDVGDLTAPTPLLLDTHVWLWHVEGAAAELSLPLRTAIERAAVDGRALVSAISVWEI